MLRLFPPGKNVVRVAAVDCELAGRRVPRGTFVILSQWVVQRDGRYFERPDEFEPDRWADGLADRLPKYAFFPFGAGPRLCLGYAFAENMLQLVLAVVTQRVHLVPVDDPARTAWDPALLRPKRGLWMLPKKRR